MPGHLLPAIAVVAAVSLAGTVWPASQPKPRSAANRTFKRKLTPPAFVQARSGRWVLLACRRECRIKAVHSFRVTR